MKSYFVVISSFLALFLAGCSCNDNRYPRQHNHVTVNPIQNDVNIEADESNAAFDVNALADIVQQSTDPAVLEQNINDPSKNINNLDLDKDGQIDFLNVTETGNNQLEIKDAAVNPAVLVARLTVTPDNNSQTAGLQIQGTPAYCGATYEYYHPHVSFGSLLLLAYLTRPHAYYVPMYGYNHYPTYYSNRRTVVRTTYKTTKSPHTRTRSSTSNSYNSKPRSSLGSPTTSKRSFGTRSSSRPVGSGGFGNSSSRSSSPSSRSSGGSRSFGSGSRSSGGSRSFGRRR